jgi:hypothetical protein
MSFHSWLQNLHSALAPGRGQRRHGQRGSLRAATHRLNVESLEDRLTPSFSPATTFPVGPHPQAVVSADLNGDGRLDLATANSDSGTVSVLLGDGAGGFGAAVDSDAGSFGGNRASLAAADFNNDGHLDLAAAIYFYDAPNYNNEFGRLSVLPGNGDGTFRAATHPLGSGVPLSVAAGDFNNDGNSDLAVSEDGGNSFGDVAVLRGDGRGGFSAPSGYSLPFPAQSLAVGDFNGDGNLDAVAVVGEGGWGGYALLGDGSGGLYPAGPHSGEFAAGSGAVAVGDFTDDGIPDLVTSEVSLAVSRGLGNGTFAALSSGSANGYVQTGVAAADFNGDGRLDAVTAIAFTETVAEFLSNGSGTPTYAGEYAVGSSPVAVAVGDFNGDGRPDVAAANAGSNAVSVLLNDGTWPPLSPLPPAVRIHDVTVTEGNTGAVAATFTVNLSAASTQTVTVAYATGNGTATAGSDYQSASGALTFAPGETSKTISVLVNGDRVPEPNETFVVNLSGATNAVIAGGQAVGTIVDDEPRISISDVTKAEGKKGQTTLFTFTVTLSGAYDQAVTMSFRTVDGTATTGDSDYVAKTGTLTFAPGETTKTVTIEVKGDSKKEASEYFYLDLSDGSTNSLFGKKRGTGTILNDD